MTCAKRQVHAWLDVDGRTFYGDNSCHNSQTVCPRRLWDDYTKCQTICKQPWHAEQHAIYEALKAGIDPTGGHIDVDHRPCPLCMDIMRSWNITWSVYGR